MNRKHGLIALFAAGLMTCLVGIWYCYLMPPRKLAWIFFWLVGAAAFVGLIIWICARKDRVPDLLSELGLNFLERKGFCFSVLPGLQNGRCFVSVLYQNRYVTPCTAEILLRPGPDTPRGKVKRLRLHLDCDGAGVGKETVPWEIPAEMAGQTIKLLVGVNVDYPQARGKMVRFKDGLPVGSVEEVDQDVPLLEAFTGTAASLELVVPLGLQDIAESVPERPSPMESPQRMPQPTSGGDSGATVRADSVPTRSLKSHEATSDLPNDVMVSRMYETT